MLIHTVLFQFNPNCSSKFIEEKILSQLVAMKGSISEILDLGWQKNISTENRDHGFKYVAIMKFKGQEQLDDYLVHKDHVAFCNDWLFPNLKNNLDSLIVFDYFCE